MSDKQAPGGKDGGTPASTVDVKHATGSFGGNGLESNRGTDNSKK